MTSIIAKLLLGYRTLQRRSKDAEFSMGAYIMRRKDRRHETSTDSWSTYSCGRYIRRRAVPSDLPFSGAGGPGFWRAQRGEVLEWTNRHAWKACVPLTGYRGFESRPLRRPGRIE